jgi:hypothetical protein
MLQPEHLVGDARDLGPDLLVVLAVAPVGAEVAVVDLAQVLLHPRGQVHAVGDVGDGHLVHRLGGPQVAPHVAADVAVAAADRVAAAGHLQGERGHVPAGLAGHARQVEEALALQVQLRPVRGEVLADHLLGEHVVAGLDGRVRGEHGALGDLGPRGVQRLAPRDLLAQQLEEQEGGVALVGVEDRGVHAERAQHAHAADAQDDLLAQAHGAVAAVEAVGDLLVLRGVAVDVRVHQVQRHAAHLHLPDRDLDRAAAQRDVEHHAPARGAQHGPHGRDVPVHVLVHVLLPAVGGDLLHDVALRVHEAHAHQRHAEVRGGLAVVAGQDAQAAGVDLQGVVHAELGGEVADGLAGHLGVVLGEPGVLLAHVAVEGGDDRVVAALEAGVGRELLQALGGHGAQQLHGVVMRVGPERAVHFLEKGAGFRMPAPPEVVGEVLEAGDAGRQLPVVIGVVAHDEGPFYLYMVPPGRRPPVEEGLCPV